MEKFQKAVPVWGTALPHQYNQFLGFHTTVCISGIRTLEIALAARNYYRLYINGEIRGNGPSRTAKGYARIDRYSFEAEGETHVAVEVIALDKPEKYCNDSTMEPGMLTAEITDENGQVLACTGCDTQNGFLYTELYYRKSMVETMSHSRGILEWYRLTPDSSSWIWGSPKFLWREPVERREPIFFLPRRAPYASHRRISVPYLTGVSDVYETAEENPGFVLKIAREFNPRWYGMLKENDQFLQKLRGMKETEFTGSIGIKENKMVEIVPGSSSFALLFERESSELGFIDFDVQVEAETVLDVMNTDHLSIYGELRANSYVTRYELSPGIYHLTTFEPKLVRYIELVFQTNGKVKLSFPQLLDYSYPDDRSCWFSCSDGELNRIYEGARRTLRLSTLDLFMDCPQRERGGWLCDSHFSAEAAWMLFGELGTEKDFLENFMKTSGMWKGFFPEVYPGSKKDASDPGIMNWSFWLMTELCAYCERSGDWEFAEENRLRVEEFVEGLLSLRGESGLIETDRGQFVDWSLANRTFSLEPISIPNNCLAVTVLEQLAGLYDQPEWKKTAIDMRKIIEKLDTEAGIFGGGGDGAVYRREALFRTDCPTEGGKALELWSGFHLDDITYIKSFVRTMGPCPEYRANPNIGKANLFIGLMIRFDVLRRLGYINQLVRELKSVYLEELKLGSGTFFENINAFSGCHGFNGMAGALLTESVLGLGQPMERSKTIHIEPCPGSLRWAEGTVQCGDGRIFFRWSADEDTRTLRMRLLLPSNWTVDFCRVPELAGWKLELNGKEIV